MSVLPKEKVLPFILSQVVSAWRQVATPCLPEPSWSWRGSGLLVQGCLQWCWGHSVVLALQECFMFGAPAGCWTPQVCCGQTAAAGKGSLCREHQQPLGSTGARCSPSSLQVLGDGDVCYPASVLFPARLIFSLALTGRRTTFSTLQDSQY